MEILVSSKDTTQAHRHSSVAYSVMGKGISSQLTVRSAGTPTMTGAMVSTSARNKNALLLLPQISVAVQANRYRLINPSVEQSPSDWSVLEYVIVTSPPHTS